MEESMNKIIWVVVGVGIIAIVYGILKGFFPNILNTIKKQLTDFVDRTFGEMTGSDKDNNKDSNLAPETGAGAGGGSSK